MALVFYSSSKCFANDRNLGNSPILFRLGKQPIAQSQDCKIFVTSDQPIKIKHMKFDVYNMIRPKKKVFLLVLLIHFSLSAQTEFVKDSLIKSPMALAILEIANYSEQTRNLVKESQELIENKSELREIQKGLANQDSVLTVSLVVLRDTMTHFNLDQLDRLEDRITFYKKKVNSWSKDIEKWREKTDEFDMQFKFDYETWSVTLDSLQAQSGNLVEFDSLQVATLDRMIHQVDGNLSTVFASQIVLKNWNDELNLVENALTLVKDETNEAFALISSKRSHSLNNIWIPEYEPIWNLNRDLKLQLSKSSFKAQLKLKASVAKRFIQENSEFYYMLFFSFLLIYACILFINKKAKRLYRNNLEVLTKGAIILKHPFVSSLIILSFLVFLFFDFPNEVKYFVLMLLILPFSLVIWNLNSDHKAKHIALFIAFSLTFIFLTIISGQPKILRFSLLSINVVTFLLAYTAQKQPELIKKENKYWLGTLPYLITAILFLSVVAFIANILGSVQLSLIFTRTIVGTIITFAMIKETIQLVEAFLFLFLMGPLYKFSNILKEDSEQVLRFINKVLRFIGYSLWFYTILDLLKIQNKLTIAVWDFVNTPLVVGELSISLANILSFFIILQFSIWLSKFIRYFLDKEVYPRTNVSIGVSGTFSLMIKYTITFVGFLFALFAAGVELSKVAVGIGALGVGVGFGLQNIVNNFVSGIILALERPLKIGDIVMVDGVEGIVKNIGLRASQIRTWDGSDVLVPNGSLISGKLTNRTFDDKLRRLDIEIQLAKDTDISKAAQVFLEAANTVPGIMKKPKAYYNFEGIHDGKATVKIYGWISDYSNGMRIGTAFKIAVFEALTKEGFEISFPVLQIKQSEQDNKTSS